MIKLKFIITILISICVFSCGNVNTPKSNEVSIYLNDMRKSADSIYNGLEFQYDSIIKSEQLKMKSNDIKISSKADSVIKKTYALWYKSDSLYKEICFDIDSLKRLNND